MVGVVSGWLLRVTHPLVGLPPLDEPLASVAMLLHILVLCLVEHELVLSRPSSRHHSLQCGAVGKGTLGCLEEVPVEGMHAAVDQTLPLTRLPPIHVAVVRCK